MTDLLALFKDGCTLFGSRVHRVGPDQWPAGTPCSDWDIGALVDHMIDEHLWLPPLLAGHDLDTAGRIVESAKRTIGPDRGAAWDAAALGSSRAVDEPGALDRQVALSRGPAPASEYLGEMIFDLVVHGWDLGHAIGLDDPLPDELVAFALPIAETFSGTPSTYFAAPVDPPADASAEERLVALTGRRPR